MTPWTGPGLPPDPWWWPYREAISVVLLCVVAALAGGLLAWLLTW